MNDAKDAFGVDLDLVRRLREGDLVSFRTIYDKYFNGMYAAAYQRLKNTSLAEEIVQEVFTRLWIKRNDLNITKGLSNYLYSSVRHLVIDYFRKELLQKKYESHYLSSEAGVNNSTEETVMINELKRSLDSIVQTMPNMCRSVYHMSRNENKSNKEIAHLLEISEKTVEGHLTKALKRIRVAFHHFSLVIILINL